MSFVGSSGRSVPVLPLRQRLRDKLPEILIEAGSVVLALLLALGANVWHEHSERVDLARRARTAILAEIASNKTLLDATLKSVHASLKKIAALEKQIGTPSGKSAAVIGFPYATLMPSSAAWHTAETTGALREFDYKWMLQIAQIYELQSSFMRAQQKVLYPAPLTPIPGMEKAGSRAQKLARRLQITAYMHRMQVLSNFGAGLERGYAAALDGKDGASQ